MAYTFGTLPSFDGVRLDRSDALLPIDTSPDACNMDTRTGALCTAKGFSRFVSDTLPDGVAPLRLYIYFIVNGAKLFAVTATTLYRYNSAGHEWVAAYTFSRSVQPAYVDFLPVRIGTDDRLLIAHGTGAMLVYNPTNNQITTFGSAEKLSDRPVCYAALYFGRLFTGGDAYHPSRLYWSKTPGGTRAIDDWRADDASENVSGGFVDVGLDDDPITGVVALSNQLIVFKRNSMYRLLGDRPGNYRVLPIDAPFQMPLHTACVRYADRLYFLTSDGLCCFDGQTVRRTGSFRAIRPLLRTADLSLTRAAACGDVLYFAIREHSDAADNDLVIEYDLLRDSFMLRRGFAPSDLLGARGALYALLHSGKIVVFDDSDSYDGDPIDAWWWTPKLDLGHKEVNKTLLALTASGSGTLGVQVRSDGGAYSVQAAFSETADSVTEIPLRGKGRVFRLRFSNVGGAPMTLDASCALLYDLARRPV